MFVAKQQLTSLSPRREILCNQTFVFARCFFLSLVSVKIIGVKIIKAALAIKYQDKSISILKQYFDISNAIPTKIDNAEITIIVLAAILLAYFQYSSLIDDIFVLYP